MGGSMESCPGTPDSQCDMLPGSIAAPATPSTPPASNVHKCPVSLYWLFLPSFNNYFDVSLIR